MLGRPLITLRTRIGSTGRHIRQELKLSNIDTGRSAQQLHQTLLERAETIRPISERVATTHPNSILAAGPEALASMVAHDIAFHLGPDIGRVNVVDDQGKLLDNSRPLFRLSDLPAAFTTDESARYLMYYDRAHQQTHLILNSPNHGMAIDDRGRSIINPQDLWLISAGYYRWTPEAHCLAFDGKSGNFPTAYDSIDNRSGTWYHEGAGAGLPPAGLRTAQHVFQALLPGHAVAITTQLDQMYAAARTYGWDTVLHTRHFDATPREAIAAPEGPSLKQLFVQWGMEDTYFGAEHEHCIGATSLNRVHTALEAQGVELRELAPLLESTAQKGQQHLTDLVDALPQLTAAALSSPHGYTIARILERALPSPRTFSPVTWKDSVQRLPQALAFTNAMGKFEQRAVTALRFQGAFITIGRELHNHLLSLPLGASGNFTHLADTVNTGLAHLETTEPWKALIALQTLTDTLMASRTIGEAATQVSLWGEAQFSNASSSWQVDTSTILHTLGIDIAPSLTYLAHAGWSPTAQAQFMSRIRHVLGLQFDYYQGWQATNSRAIEATKSLLAQLPAVVSTLQNAGWPSNAQQGLLMLATRSIATYAHNHHGPTANNTGAPISTRIRKALAVMRELEWDTNQQQHILTTIGIRAQESDQWNMIRDLPAAHQQLLAAGWPLRARQQLILRAFEVSIKGEMQALAESIEQLQAHQWSWQRQQAFLQRELDTARYYGRTLYLLNRRIVAAAEQSPSAVEQLDQQS